MIKIKTSQILIIILSTVFITSMLIGSYAYYYNKILFQSREKIYQTKIDNLQNQINLLTQNNSELREMK